MRLFTSLIIPLSFKHLISITHSIIDPAYEVLIFLRLRSGNITEAFPERSRRVAGYFKHQKAESITRLKLACSYAEPI